MTDHNFCAGLTLVIQASIDGVPRHETVLTVGQTPALLVGLGMPDFPLVITGKTIDKIFFDHGITKRMIERLHSLVSAPRTIYRTAPPHSTGSVVVTFEERKGCPVIVSIRSSKQFGRGQPLANEITSMYAKEGGGFEKLWESNGLLLWAKK